MKWMKDVKTCMKAGKRCSNIIVGGTTVIVGGTTVIVGGTTVTVGGTTVIVGGTTVIEDYYTRLVLVLPFNRFIIRLTKFNCSKDLLRLLSCHKINLVVSLRINFTDNPRILHHKAL